MGVLRLFWGSWSLRILMAAIVAFGVYNASGIHMIRYLPEALPSLQGAAPIWIFWVCFAWVIVAGVTLVMALESVKLMGLLIISGIVTVGFVALYMQGIITFNNQSMFDSILPLGGTLVLVIALKWSVFKRKVAALFNTDGGDE